MRRATAVCLSLCAALAAGPLARADDGPPAREQVLRGLEDPGFAPRRDAVRAAKAHPDPAYLPPLLALLAGDPHPNVRGFAADALTAYRDERIVPTLIATARADEWPGPRQAALVALGETRDPRGYEVLLAALSGGDGAYAARGLGLLGDPRAFEAVAEAYRGRAQNEPLLADLGPDALMALDAERGRDVLLAAFEKTTPYARMTIASALAHHPHPALRRALHAHLGAADPALRHAAIALLGRVGDEETGRLLLARFIAPGDSAEPGDQAALARALAALQVAEAAAPLVGALAPGAPEELRSALADALAGLADPATLAPVLAALAREEGAHAKVRLLHVVARIGDAAALASVAALVDDPGYSSQPRHVSSIWSWPWNVRVAAMALWTARTLLDGRPPLERDALSTFRGESPSAWETAARDTFSRWWAEHRGDPRYRLGE